MDDPIRDDDDEIKDPDAVGPEDDLDSDIEIPISALGEDGEPLDPNVEEDEDEEKVEMDKFDDEDEM